MTYESVPNSVNVSPWLKQNRGSSPDESEQICVSHHYQVEKAKRPLACPRLCCKLQTRNKPWHPTKSLTHRSPWSKTLFCIQLTHQQLELGVARSVRSGISAMDFEIDNNSKSAFIFETAASFFSISNFLFLILERDFLYVVAIGIFDFL